MILLARHGRTSYNEKGIVIGQMDPGLSAEGRRDCGQISDVLRNFEVELIITSPLRRACQTSRVIARDLNVPVTEDAELKELSCGIWQGKPRTAVLPENKPIRQDWFFYPPGGESYSIAERRVGNFVRKIEKMEEKTDILVMGHAAVNLVFVKLWMNLSIEKALTFVHHHNVVYLIEDRKNLSWINTDGQKGVGFWE